MIDLVKKPYQMSGLRNTSYYHNNNVSRSMNSINDRREIEFETNLFVDFSCFILWAVFGIIVIVIFKKLHIKKSTNLIFDTKIVLFQFWRNYLNKKYELLGMSLALSTLNSESKILYIPFIYFEKYEKVRDISMHSTRNNSAIHIVIHVIV